jgi:DNA transposition AAA+ family ATPase
VNPGDEARDLLRAYQARTGLSIGNIGALMGYAKQTLTQFAANCYPANEQPIALRIKAWIGANPPEITVPEGRLYRTRNVRILEEQIARAREGEHSLIYGPPGTQKTYVFEHCWAESLRRDGLTSPTLAYIYASDAMTRKSLLQEIARALVCYPGGQTHQVLTNLIFSVRRRRPAPTLIVDEAQHLRGDRRMLEILRELADRARIGLIIAGHDNLEAIFDPQTSPLEQWVSRIDYRLRLPGLDEKEVREIANAELGPLSDPVMTIILKESRADDRQTGQKYFSARYLFKIIKQVRERRRKGNGAGRPQ